MKNDEKMRLYDIWSEVPSEACKEFSNGRFKGTDINPQWRIQVLTEQFGPCGIGWYYTIDRQWSEEVAGQVLAYCNVSLYVKINGEWSKPIMGTGGNWESKSNASNDECYKMALTDALSIACKALGIGAKIWFKAAKSKYTMQQPTYEGNKQQEAQGDALAGLRAKIAKAEEVIAAMKTPEEILAYIKNNDAENGCAMLLPIKGQKVSEEEEKLRSDFRVWALAKYNSHAK